MIAVIWRFFVALFDWRILWRKVNGQQVANLAFGVNMSGDFGHLVLERPLSVRTLDQRTAEINNVNNVNVEVVRLNADGFERTHRVFWFIFEWTIGQFLAWWIQKKSIRLIKKNLNEQEKESWRTVEGRQQILAGFRQNFGKKRVAELFELHTRLFNRSSPLLQHFCKNVANAPALDDAYNALGSFSFIGQTIWPESAEPDVFSRFYLSCPNGQAVRNRYRIVANLYKEMSGGTLSIAAGSAQALIHANIESENELLLTDIDVGTLSLAKRRAKQAGISGKVSFLQAPFKYLPKRLAGEKFDTVEGCGIFEYLSDKQSLFLLGLMLNFLRPRGKVIVSGMTETRGADLLRKTYNWDIIYRSPEELVNLVKRAGGRNIKIYVEPWGIHYVVSFTN